MAFGTFLIILVIIVIVYDLVILRQSAMASGLDQRRHMQDAQTRGIVLRVARCWLGKREKRTREEKGGEN